MFVCVCLSLELLCLCMSLSLSIYIYLYFSVYISYICMCIQSDGAKRSKTILPMLMSATYCLLLTGTTILSGLFMAIRVIKVHDIHM